MYTCPICGKKYRPRRDAETCSDVCRAKLNYRRKKAKAQAKAERLSRLEDLARQVFDAVRAGDIGLAIERLDLLDRELAK